MKQKRTRNPKIRREKFAKDIVYSLEIDSIRANAAQPRKDFDIDSIIKLADSIRRYGILQPLSVRKAPRNELHHSEHESKRFNLVADVLSASQEPFNCSPDVSRETSDFQLTQLRIDDFGDPKAECSLSENKKDSKDKRSPQQEYELVAGERRLRAAKMLGMRFVPCIIVDVNDAISAELALVENMLRENLNMFEQAEAFSNLSNKYSLTQEEIAAKMSLSQSAVANKLRLLKLTDRERILITEHNLTERHARATLRIADPSKREECIHYIIDHSLNVSETDKYISSIISHPTTELRQKDAPTPEKLCANIYKFISKMQSASGQYLTVNRKSDSQNVVITLTVKKNGKATS